MRAGVLAPEMALADPYYRRACWGLHPERTDPASLIRFDLIKTAQGWQFTETHTNTPVGLSYAVQNRRFLTQEAADYYRARTTIPSSIPPCSSRIPYGNSDLIQHKSPPWFS